MRKTRYYKHKEFALPLRVRGFFLLVTLDLDINASVRSGQVRKIWVHTC